MSNKKTYSELKQMQSLPLKYKIRMTQERIKDWYKYWRGNVFVSFSGGKDSTVLLDLVRDIYPDVHAVFIDTGLEFPELREFAKNTPNTLFIYPRRNLKEIIKEYGYPVISKEQARYIYEYCNTTKEHIRKQRWEGNGKGRFKISEKWKFLVDAPFKVSSYCCYAMKVSPVDRYVNLTKNKPIIGSMAEESNLRRSDYLRHGCNSYSSKPKSKPLSFWKQEDIWEYINQYNIPYSSIYDKGYSRTGCTICGFGVQNEKEPNRFQMLKQTHPHLWRYGIYELGYKEVFDYIGIPYE